jgi:hypothetical protein
MQPEADAVEAEISQVGAPLAGLIRSKQVMGVAGAVGIIVLLLFELHVA